MKPLYSYHIFMFPFKWELKSRKDKSFSERTAIKDIEPIGLGWKHIATPKTDAYKTELYNEKNFFYEFTHQALYDTEHGKDFIKHFERSEAYLSDVTYKIHVIAHKEDTYTLKVKSICLNLYETGVGILSFYLENYESPDIEDILRINQFGRRIYPPFFGNNDDIAETKTHVLADYIAIEGLTGNPHNYFEDFTDFKTESLWKPAKFIKNLIKDLSSDMDIKSVVDDRMFVMCWYCNNQFSQIIKNTSDFDNFDKWIQNDDWYKFLFVDSNSATCQNDDLRKKVIKKHTYTRWQKDGAIYGCTRYSMVFISNLPPKEYLLTNFRTMYARLVELTLIQRACVLKYADEIAKTTNENKTGKVSEEISNIYRKYIVFINKIYYKEVTAQEQGIELYNMLQKAMKIEEQVNGLGGEISELHKYSTFLEDNERNTNIELLTIISALIVIPTLIVTYIGVSEKHIWIPLSFIPLAIITLFAISRKNKKYKLRWIYFIFLLVFLFLFFLSLNCSANGWI